MIMDWRHWGRLKERLRAIADGECDFWEAGERSEANGGDRT